MKAATPPPLTSGEIEELEGLHEKATHIPWPSSADHDRFVARMIDILPRLLSSLKQSGGSAGKGAERDAVIRECAEIADKTLENGVPRDRWDDADRAVDNAREDVLAALSALLAAQGNTSAAGELKGCPFCGGRLILDTKINRIEHPDIPASDQDCPMRPYGFAAGRQDLIAAWNRRTPPSTAGWLPISTAPKDQVILVADEDRTVHLVSWGDCCPGYPNSPRMRWCVNWSYGEHGYHIIEHPILWRPVPEVPAPSQEGASEGEGET